MTVERALVLSTVLIAAHAASVPATGTAHDAGPSCHPLSAADWAGRCGSREGRDEIERLLGDCRRLRVFEHVDTAREACGILHSGEGASTCDRARRQLLATTLNVASRRLSGECCIEWRGHEVRLRDVMDLHAEDCRAGRGCEDVRAFSALANDRDHVRPCGGGRPPHGERGCCTPRSKGFWHRQCLGIGAIGPGRGRGHGPGLHPAFSEDDLRRILALADRRIGGRCHGACEALDEQNYRTPRGRALAQHAALVLNLEAGYLDGCGRDDALDVVRRVERLIDAGDFEQAKDVAERGNVGVSVRRCEGSGHGGRDDAGDEHPHRDGDKDHDGKGKGKGKRK